MLINEETNQEIFWTKYNGLEDRPFLEELYNNLEWIQKHNCLLNTDKINNLNIFLEEFEYHLYYLNILIFTEDLETKKIIINDFYRQDCVESIQKIIDSFNDKNFSIYKYKNKLSNLFIDNWHSIEKVDFHDFWVIFNDFLKNIFFTNTNKSLLEKKSDIVNKIIDSISGNKYLLNLTKELYSFFKNKINIRKIIIKNLEKIFEINPQNEKYFFYSGLYFWFLKIHFEEFKNEEFIENKIYLFLDFCKNISNISKMALWNQIKSAFHGNKLASNKKIKKYLDDFRLTIEIDSKEFIEHKLTIDQDYENFEIERQSIFKLSGFMFLFPTILKNKKFEFEPIFSIFDLEGANILDDIIKSLNPNAEFLGPLLPLMYIVDRNVSDFFHKNKIFYNEYFKRWFPFFKFNLFEKLNFSDEEKLTFNLHLWSVIESFSYIDFEKIKYKIPGYLFSAISAIELLLKKIMDFIGKPLGKGGKISTRLAESSVQGLTISKDYVDYISNKTLKTIYLYLYEDRSKDGLEIRNLLMHGDSSFLSSQLAPQSFAWTRVILFSLVEELIYNLLVKGKNIM